MNDILEYIRLSDHILNGIPIKKLVDDGYIPKKKNPPIKIKDGKITDIILSQSLVKSIFWTGPATPHIGSWDMLPHACPWQFYNLNVTQKYRYPQSKSMMLGNFFETLCIGSGAYSKTLSIPKKYKDELNTVDEDRVYDAVERFKRVVKETGIIIAHNNTQVEHSIPILDTDHEDIRIKFKMVADLISPFFYQDINYDVTIIDLKLTKDRNLDFVNPYKPWESYAWGSPEKMSMFQGTSYSEGFQMPFINLVFDIPKENPGWKVVPVKTLISHSDDNEARLRNLEFKQGVKDTISTLVEWNNNEWPKNKGSWCTKCPVEDCEMKNFIEHV